MEQRRESPVQEAECLLLCDKNVYTVISLTEWTFMNVTRLSFSLSAPLAGGVIGAEIGLIKRTEDTGTHST